MSGEVTPLPKSKLHAIIHFQNSKQPSSHHVAYCIKDKKAYYFDSLHWYPPKVLEHYYQPLYISDYVIQLFNTNSCGQLCLLFLYLIFHVNILFYPCTVSLINKRLSTSTEITQKNI